MDKSGRSKINKEIGKLTYNRYHEKIPLDELFSILEKRGVTVIDEEGNPWSGFLCGESGHCTFDTTDRKLFLALSWYKMQSGKFEIVAYVS